MDRSRLITVLAGLAVSLAISAALWWFFHSVVFVLFLPFVPFLFRGSDREEQPAPRICPTCGFQTRDDRFGYCPRDGTRLDERPR